MKWLYPSLLILLAGSIAGCSSDPEPVSDTDAVADTEEADTMVPEDVIEETGITLVPGTVICNRHTPYVASSPIGGEVDLTVNDVPQTGTYDAGHVVFTGRVDFVACVQGEGSELLMLSISTADPDTELAAGQSFTIASGEASVKVQSADGSTTAIAGNGSTGTLTLDAWDTATGTFTISGSIIGPDLAPAQATFTVVAAP